MIDNSWDKGTVVLVAASIGAITSLMGLGVKAIVDYFREKRERKDKYYFTLLEKRFEAHQKVFSLMEKLKPALNETDWKQKVKIIGNVRDWYYDNCLYLEPTVRKDFREAIIDVGSLKDQWATYHAEGRSTNNWDTPEMIKQREELFRIAKNIQQGIQKKIEKHINIYYRKME